MRGATVNSRVTFRHPFSLNGVTEIHPPGTYSIETKDRHYWTFPFLWETKTITTIRIGMNAGLDGSLHKYAVDPRNLFGAMERDRLSIAS